MLLIAVSVFLAELVIMAFLGMLRPLSPPFEAFLDAFVLTLIVFPILYAFAFRPLIVNIAQRRRAEERLTHNQERLRALASELVMAEESERRRLALDFHDSLSPFLNSAKMKLDALRRSSAPDERLREIEELITEAQRSTRSLTFELSPPILYDLGLEAAMQWLAEDTGKRYDLEVSYRNARQLEPMDERLSLLLFRAVRELLVNVAQHAGTNRARLFVYRETDDVRVDVEDDGRGFPAGFDLAKRVERPLKERFGLFSIRERLVEFGGRMEIQSSPGSTVVTLTLPFLPKSKQEADEPARR